MNTNSVRLSISGTVQGVGMRYYIQKTARRLGLAGYVRNEPNGTVTCVVKGKEPTIKQLIAAIEDHGLGLIDDITKQPATDTINSPAFDIRF